VGGFPEGLRSAEDLLFISKISDGCFRVADAPQALVTWALQPTFKATYNRFAVYSRSNLRAGLWREWQAATFGRYVALGLCALGLAMVTTRWWAIVTGVLFLLMFLVRTVVALVRSRRSSPAHLVRNLKRLTVLFPLLVTIDAATIVGTFKWFWRDWLRLPRY
jgi:hypothetical protein